MPRNFEKKRPIDATRLERLTGAVNAVKNNPMSIRKAAAEFNVNRCSIERRLKKEVGGVGRATVLSVMEERMLAKLIDDVAEWGFPLGGGMGESTTGRKTFSLSRLRYVMNTALGHIYTFEIFQIF